MMMTMDDDANTNMPPPDNLDAVSQAAGPAPRRAPSHRPAHPLRIAIIVGVLAVIVLGIVYGRAYAKRAAMLRAQQACLDYVAPVDQIVYDEELGRAKALLARGGEYAPVPSGDSASGTPVAGHVPSAWRAIRSWAMPLQPTPNGAVLFLHERRTHVGDKQVLVCVEADRVARKLRITLIHPGASTLDPTPVTDLELAPPPQPDLVVLKSGGEPFENKLPPAGRAGRDARADLRFFAGQFDPTDQTRFNLPYEFNGQRGEFDCGLEDERVVYYVDRRFAKE
jgi:hypothetical protein